MFLLNVYDIRYSRINHTTSKKTKTIDKLQYNAIIH